ncbi:hypothetical protein [Marinitoga lauensis]
MFLLAGGKKIQILKEILEGNDYPARFVKPKENLLYFISKK